jgi:hypothetical protein
MNPRRALSRVGLALIVANEIRGVAMVAWLVWARFH